MTNNVPKQGHMELTEQRMADRMRAVAVAASGVLGAGSREALREVLEAACRSVLSFDTFFIQSYDAETHTLHGFGGYDAGVYSAPNTVPVAGTPGERVIQSRRSLLTHHSDAPEGQGAHLTGTTRRSESVIRTPILMGEHVVGVLSIHSYTPHLYTEQDVEVIEVIASLAATALSNLRLKEKEAEAERARHVSETRFRTMFEQFPLSVQIFDPQGRTLAVNKAWEKLFGLTLDDVRHFNPLHDPQLAPIRDHLQRGFSGEAVTIPPHPFDASVFDLDQEAPAKTNWLEVTVWPMRDQAGSVHEVIVLHRDVTDQIEAEASLQQARDELEQRVASRTAELAERTAELTEAEQRFRAIVEASPTPLLLSRTTDGVVLYANDRLEALVGVPPGGLIGKKTPDFYYDPSDRPQILESVRQKGYVRDLELRIRRADGTPRWVSLSAQRLDYNGEPTVATALVDITERKETEQALRTSEESYRGLFDTLAELVYIQNLEGRFLNVNEAVVQAYGYEREELIGQTPAMLAAPDRVDVEAVMACFRRAVEGEPQRFDWWGRRKDGSVFPKEVVLKRSIYFGQDVVIAVARNISDRVEAEEALRRSEEHFRRLIENASDLISIIDTEGIIQYQSPAITRLVGYTPQELIGTNAFDLIAPDDLPETLARLQQVVEEPGTSVFAEFRFRHKDGSWRVLEATGRTLLPSTAEAGIIVNSRDVTERVEAERKIRLQKTLLEAQGEASIDGILVVSAEGKILSYNQRFIELWNIPPEVVAARTDEAALNAVLSQLQDPEAFLARVEYLYAHPNEKARDEIGLLDGRVFDRYSAPVISSEGEYYGRIWFFRDMTVEKHYAENLEQARLEADEARVQASRYAKSLENELEVGREIQKGFLPATLPHPPGWEIAARFHPASQVAGDFYDAFELPTGRIGLVIADVCGKGVGAALFMALFQSLIRAYAERASSSAAKRTGHSDEAVLTEAILATNGYITRVHKPAHMFASLFFGLLDPGTGTLHYVNAGHEPPLVSCPDQPVKRLMPTGPALGLMPNAPFQVVKTRLAPGDLLVAYTDGITEARNVERDFFTEERLLHLLNGHAPDISAACVLDRIEGAVHAFMGDTAPSDDHTLMAIRRSVA